MADGAAFTVAVGSEDAVERCILDWGKRAIHIQAATDVVKGGYVQRPGGTIGLPWLTSSYRSKALGGLLGRTLPDHVSEAAIPRPKQTLLRRTQQNPSESLILLLERW